MDTKTSPDEVEYQIGAHSVDATPISFNDGTDDQDDEFIEFQLEARTVFKRLADDIYETEEAGIREPLTNAVTAILRATTEHQLPADEGVVNITLNHQESGSNVLTIRDNGVGISKQELQKVVSVIGRSTVRDTGDLAGQFGMGFLAMFKLTGTDGGFIMHTHSRRDGAEPISGVWKSGGFAPDTDGTLPGGFAEDEYGTEFELILRDDVDPADVRDWVETNAEWARVPVIYNEYDEDDENIENEDYNVKQFRDTYANGTDKCFILDTPYFRAVCSPEAEGRTVLLDVPIERNAGFSYSGPWSLDIRLKNENSVVVDGPHEGLMPVQAAEYQEMDAQRQEKYVPKSSLTEDDIVLPGPIGTRGTLASKDSFWSWLGDQFDAQYEDWVRGILNRADTPEAIVSLPDFEYDLLFEDILNLGRSTITADNIERWFSHKGVDISDEMASLFEALLRKVEEAPRTGGDISLARTRQKKRPYRIVESTRKNDREGEVYIGATMNRKKAEVVWDDNPHNAVVKVDNDNYEFFQNQLGWNLLKKVTKSRLDQFDISEEVRDLFLGNRQLDTSDPEPESTLPCNELVMHYGTGKYRKTRIDIGELKVECLKGERDDVLPYVGYKQPERVLAFPDTCDRNLSDYYYIADETTMLFKCDQSEWEYLQDAPFITHINEYVKSVENQEITTQEGQIPIGEVDGDRLVLHRLPDDTARLFRSEPLITDLAETLEEVAWVDELYSVNHSFEDVLYVPVTDEELHQLRLCLEEKTVIDGNDESYEGVGTAVTGPPPRRLYLRSALGADVDIDEITYLKQTLNQRATRYEVAGSRIKHLIDFVAESLDAGVTPPSQASDLADE